MINRRQDGTWEARHNGETLGPFNSNAAAWRALDRAANEPINRGEDVAEWVAKQDANR
jgi:hypothetical protein